MTENVFPAQENSVVLEKIENGLAIVNPQPS